VRFDGRDLTGLVAHQRTRLGLARSFQLPRPFASMTVADNLRIPLLYTVNARRKPALTEAEIGERCDELLTVVASPTGAAYPKDLTQVDMASSNSPAPWRRRPKLLMATRRWPAFPFRSQTTSSRC